MRGNFPVASSLVEHPCAFILPADGVGVDKIHSQIPSREVSLMSYYFSKILEMSFDEAVNRVTEELKKKGFGILTDINVREKLKEKLNVDFRNYRILGACNPPFAYQALQAEDKIGTMLPCNVIVQENAEGDVEVAAVDPIASMQAIQNPKLRDIAEHVQAKLKAVVENL
jgi:uncharacterized protein (DUF302 family)